MDGMVARLLRAEKTSAEFELYSKAQEEAWRLEQRSGINKKFSYHHDFDQNGLLYWIGACGSCICGCESCCCTGTLHNTAGWQNPAKLGLVTLRSSQVDRGQISDILEEKNTSFFLNPSANNAWFEVDLGGYAIIPTHYTLRHSQVNPAEHFIRNWRLQGSNDGIKWATLSSHRRDATIDGSRLTATFSVRVEC
jgi:hypothetical protein